MAVVLVTGGSSGIGLALVKRLATAGDEIFSASRNPERGGEIEGVTLLKLDVSDPAAARPAIERVVEKAGRIDAVVNNACAGVLASVEDTSEDEGLHTFQTNVLR